MKSVAFFIQIVSLLIICSCNQSDLKNEKSPSANPVKVSNGIVQKFMLSFEDDLTIDSNSLIFYYSKPFDTNFVIHFRDTGKMVIGTYYETIPGLQSDLEGITDSGVKFLLFEGFSFEIDKSMWSSIKQNTTDLVNLNDSGGQRVCFDYSDFLLAHNSKVIKVSNDNLVYFNKFKEVIKSTVVNRVNTVRKRLNAARNTN